MSYCWKLMVSSLRGNTSSSSWNYQDLSSRWNCYNVTKYHDMGKKTFNCDELNSWWAVNVPCHQIISMKFYSVYTEWKWNPIKSYQLSLIISRFQEEIGSSSHPRRQTQGLGVPGRCFNTSSNLGVEDGISRGTLTRNNGTRKEVEKCNWCKCSGDN